MKVKTHSPIAVILDDDSIFRHILSRLLQKYGFHTIEWFDPTCFIRESSAIRPDLFFIDISINEDSDGMEVIKTLALNPVLKDSKIFAVSSTYSQPTLDKAINFGAVDFLVKPLDRHIVLSKISKFFKTEELSLEEWSIFPERFEGLPIEALLEISIDSLDEDGFNLTSKHLPTKGSVISISGPLVHEITKKNSSILLTIKNTIKCKEDNSYKIRAEFSRENEKLIESVKSWIRKNYSLQAQ